MDLGRILQSAGYQQVYVTECMQMRALLYRDTHGLQQPCAPVSSARTAMADHLRDRKRAVYSVTSSSSPSHTMMPGNPGLLYPPSWSSPAQATMCCTASFVLRPRLHRLSNGLVQRVLGETSVPQNCYGEKCCRHMVSLAE